MREKLKTLILQQVVHTPSLESTTRHSVDTFQKIWGTWTSLKHRKRNRKAQISSCVPLLMLQNVPSVVSRPLPLAWTCFIFAWCSWFRFLEVRLSSYHWCKTCSALHPLFVLQKHDISDEEHKWKPRRREIKLEHLARRRCSCLCKVKLSGTSTAVWYEEVLQSHSQPPTHTITHTPSHTRSVCTFSCRRREQRCFSLNRITLVSQAPRVETRRLTNRLNNLINGWFQLRFISLHCLLVQ